ncbi:MAG: TRAP transporter substrate-binding protein [Pseudorhodoplanes sp.]|nr:TRAP transporter substrate-binding protein [Pseudorhodoplanes sp.]
MNRVTTAAIAALFACAVSGAPAAAKTVLKLGNVQAPGMPVQTGLKKFAELVAERTKGDIEIQIFPAAQLGSEQEILEGVHIGSIHMFEGSAGSLGRFLAKLDALSCPFLWKSQDSMVKTVRGEIGQELAQELLKTRRMRILDMGWIFGIRHLTTAKTPVKTPADAKGLKIRVQPDAIYLATVKAMGGSPTPIPASEIYTSLQTGVVDGQENPVSNIWQRKLHEVQKFLIRTGHITQNQLIVINEDVFQALKPEHRKIITDAAVEAGNYQNGLIDKIEAADLESLKKGGMTVIDPDVTAFRAAARSVCRDAALEKKWGAGFFDRLEKTQQ